MMTNSGINSNISPSDRIRKKVQELIPDFQKFCLESDYDVVIPIESEGFAILWPKLKPGYDEKPRIIPSSVIKKAEPKDLNQKKVLLEDTSTYSGETIFRYKDEINRLFPEAQVELASMVVYKELKAHNQFVYPNQLLLSQNQYDWARDSIAQYISGNVFMHYGDPPLWAFHYPPAERDRLFELLQEMSAFYPLPIYSNDDNNWNRFSIDYIQLKDTCWLPSPIQPEEFIKIRLFIHKSQPILLVLPLFFPIVPKDISLGLQEILRSATSYFPPGFDALLDYSKEVNRDAYLYMRWISTIGSMLLLKDFHKQLAKLGLELQPSTPFLRGPIPNLRNYSCKRDVLLAFESVINTMLYDKSIKTTSKAVFSFDKVTEIKIYKTPLSTELELVPSEQYIAAVIGTASTKHYGSAQIPRVLVDNASLCEFTFPELKSLAKQLTPLGLNRALDVLVDESVLNLCFKEDANHKIHRGYYVGGESKRIILETLGYAFAEILSG